MALPTYSKTVGTVFTIAAREHLSRTPKDNFYTGCPGLTHMRSKAMSKPGGQTLVVPVKLGSEPIGGAYTKATALAMTDVDNLSEAQYGWSFYYEPVVVYHQDMWTSRGTDALLDIVKFKTDDAVARLKRKVATALYAASPAAHELQGLPVAIVDDPTADVAYGNLNGVSTAQPGWRNYKQTSVGSYATNGEDALRVMLRTLADNSESGRPEILVTDPTTFTYAHKQLWGRHTINSSVNSPKGQQYANMGYSVIEIEGIPLVSDRYCTSGAIYALNSEAAQLVEMKGQGFVLHPDGFVSALANNQMAWKSAVIWAGQLATFERRGLGKATGITA